MNGIGSYSIVSNFITEILQLHTKMLCSNAVQTNSQIENNTNSTHSSANSSILVPPPLNLLPPKLDFQLPKPLPQEIKYIQGPCLGTGAFGKVYQGMDISSGNQLAIKHISTQFLSENQNTEIYNEITLLANLRHPNIVKIYDYQITKKELKIYLEVLQISVQSLTKKFNGLPEPLVKNLAFQLAQAVSFLHSFNVSHCDIKCANLMLNENQNLKLVDFGSAIQSQVEISGIRGSPYWLAPEILQNSSYDAKKADVWSFGATIYEMICGVPMYNQFKSAPAVLYFLSQNQQAPEINFGSQKLKKLLRKIFQPPEIRVTMQEILDDPFFSGKGSEMVSLNVRENLEIQNKGEEGEEHMNILQESIIGKSPVRQVQEEAEGNVKDVDDGLMVQAEWAITIDNVDVLIDEHNKTIFSKFFEYKNM